MSSYGRPGFTAEYLDDDPAPGEFGSFGIALEDNRDEPREEWDDDYGAEFDLKLPHQCDSWSIAAGDRGHVLEAARRFREELSKAIAKLEGDQVSEGLPWPPWLEKLTDRERIRAIVKAVAACYTAHPEHMDEPDLHEQHCTATMAEHFLAKVPECR
jgi:hypothetical protein